VQDFKLQSHGSQQDSVAGSSECGNKPP